MSIQAKPKKLVNDILDTIGVGYPLLESPELLLIIKYFFNALKFGFPSQNKFDEYTAEESFSRRREAFFDLEHRHMESYVITEFFEIPGNLHELCPTKVADRKCYKGELLLTRHDLKEDPTHIEVQVMDSYVDLDDRRWYRMTVSEFKDIRRFLRRAANKNKKLYLTKKGSQVYNRLNAKKRMGSC